MKLLIPILILAVVLIAGCISSGYSSRDHFEEFIELSKCQSDFECFVGQEYAGIYLPSSELMCVTKAVIDKFDNWFKSKVIFSCSCDTTSNECIKTITNPEITITRIIDGDTYELANGERIRVLGIDYPEITEDRIGKWTDMGINKSRVIECYHKGIELLEDWILNKEVNLTIDINEQNKDKYNRSLRYVTMGYTDVGRNLISMGYAVMYDPTEPECKRCSYYQGLTTISKTETRQNYSCLWGE